MWWKKKRHLDLGRRRNEWSKLHIHTRGIYKSTHKQRNLNTVKVLGFEAFRLCTYSFSSTRHSIIWFNSCFQNMKTLGNKTSYWLSHCYCTELPKISYHDEQLKKLSVISSQRQETLIARAGPTQWHDNYNPCTWNFVTIALNLGILGIGGPNCETIQPWKGEYNFDTWRHLNAQSAVCNLAL